MTRIATIVLVGIAVTGPLVLLAGMRAAATLRNDVASWIGTEHPDRSALDRLQRLFGRDDVILVSWVGCDVDDERLGRVTDELRGDDLFDAVTNGADLLATIADSARIDEETARGRLRGTLLGDDLRTTAIAATLSVTGSESRGEAVGRVESAVRSAGIGEADVRLAGPGYELHLIDRNSLWSPLEIVPYIVLLMAGLTLWYLRGVWITLALVAVSGYAGLSTIAMVWLAGIDLDALVWTLPTLISLLTTSCSLHLVNYYRDAAHGIEPSRAAARCLALGWRPTVASAVTTAAGLASLVVSETEPIRRFGLFGALGVLFGAGIALATVPTLARWLLPLRSSAESEARRTDWERFAEWLARRRWSVLLLGGGVVLALAIRLPELRSSVSPTAFFPRGSRVHDDLGWFEEHVMATGSVELLLTFRDPGQTSPMDRLESVVAIEAALRDDPDVGETTSAATFLPDPPEGKGVRVMLARRLYRERLGDDLAELRAARYLSTDDGAEVWRVSVRTPRMQEVDLDHLRTRIERHVGDVARASNGPTPDLAVTGIVPMFRTVEAQFLTDLWRSYTAGFAVISVVVLIVLRSIGGGVLSALPNLFPAATVLGGVAWLGVRLDVGSVMSASVALGIAVDDTLHYLLWCQREVDDGRDRAEAVASTLRHCGPAMIQTSTVCGFGALLYGVSVFLPTVRFGVLLSAMMFSALVGDLVLLPAMLVTPLGRLMLRRPAIPANEGQP